MRTACLVGNGVSIAYSSELAVPTLTKDLHALFRDAGATEPEIALARFAESLSFAEGSHFEALLGPLSATAEGIRYLPGMAALAQGAGADAVVGALDVVSKFLEDVHRIGLAITLGHVAQRSVGGRYDEVIRPLASELIALGSPSDMTIATLNYDGLLHSGMMDAGRIGAFEYNIVDLAAGYSDDSHLVTPGTWLVGHPLREFDDLLEDRAALLQLHGSLGWLSDTGGDGRIWRFDLQALRNANYWDHLRSGNTAWLPVVVLTDRKERAIVNWPFSLAYEIFLSRLIDADRWLIAGYGFGDIPVNGLLANAYRERRRLGLLDPSVLVVGLDHDSANLRTQAVNAFRVPEQLVTACGLGIPIAFETPEWRAWAQPG